MNKQTNLTVILSDIHTSHTWQTNWNELGDLLRWQHYLFVLITLSKKNSTNTRSGKLKQALASLHGCGNRVSLWEWTQWRWHRLFYTGYKWLFFSLYTIAQRLGCEGLFTSSSRAFWGYPCSHLPPGGHKHIEKILQEVLLHILFSVSRFSFRNKGIIFDVISRIC